MSNETIILKIIEGINKSEEKKLCIKYINEVAGGDVVGDIDDSLYSGQVISAIQ